MDTSTLVLTGVAYVLGIFSIIVYNRYRKGFVSEVLFFPDERMPCRTFYQELDGKETVCRQIPKCQFAHLEDGKTSFMRIMEILNEAQRTIDLCVYDFTESKLADFLIKKFNEGLQIKIVTDAHVERKVAPSGGDSAGGGATSSSGKPNNGANGQELIVLTTGGGASKEPSNQKSHVRHKSKERQNNNNNKNNKNSDNEQTSENQKGKQAKGKNNHQKNQQQQVPGGQKASQQSPGPVGAVQMQRVSHKGDQIPSLQQAGIPIRVNANNGPFGALMHNKFVIVDDKYLMMGSFNWTHSAITRNHEAILLTDDSRVVSKFRNKFKDMWMLLQDRPADRKA